MLEIHTQRGESLKERPTDSLEFRVGMGQGQDMGESLKASAWGPTLTRVWGTGPLSAYGSGR